MAGHLHPAYAQSLAEFGTPRELPCSKGWFLQREYSMKTSKDEKIKEGEG